MVTVFDGGMAATRAVNMFVVFVLVSHFIPHFSVVKKIIRLDSLSPTHFHALIRSRSMSDVFVSKTVKNVFSLTSLADQTLAPKQLQSLRNRGNVVMQMSVSSETHISCWASNDRIRSRFASPNARKMLAARSHNWSSTRSYERFSCDSPVQISSSSTKPSIHHSIR